jgi:(p)ppGpp synthase/HD superfamily hydrolase
MSERLERFLTELESAEVIARTAHEGHTDKVGAPYIEHVQRVVAAVTAAGGDARAQAVAWLHDVIEDTAEWTRDSLIEVGGISPEVADAVQALSRSETETYAAYIDRLVFAKNPLVLQVKLADMHDHLRPGFPPPDRLRERYEKALPKLIEATS